MGQQCDGDGERVGGDSGAKKGRRTQSKPSKQK